MQNILLLEADYKNKFPPIGLMKLAYYHSNHRGDLVCFSKGKLPKSLKSTVRDRMNASSYYQNRYGEHLQGYLDKLDETIQTGCWDRIYITTLFTFEWDKTIKLIEYAKSLVSDPSKMMIGGVAATLMPHEFEKETGIKPHHGLLEDSSQLGYEPGICIDNLIPDYSILEHIEYEYPCANGYFLTATRGCGNKCSFCAVQTLEPKYKDYLPILPRIEKIRKLYGEKRNLYLLDNNVLKSRAFPQIIEDIKGAGFAKGATWMNPSTGKPNKRSVDFNQGLDSKFLTDDKARLLGEIALEPAHIAFDHIGEEKKYRNAVALMDKYDIRNISSYLLYNTASFRGKGNQRQADTPHDLYQRMRISYGLNREINDRRAKDGMQRFDCFSFPMRFVPLNAKDRTFVGDHWTPHLLAGLRTMLQPSHGGVFPTPDYFDYMYGRDYEEFYKTLLMPHEYVRHKGKPAHKYPSGEHPYKNWLLCIDAWLKLYDTLEQAEREAFERIIGSNQFDVGIYTDIANPTIRNLYLHYFTGATLPHLLEHIAETPHFEAARQYLMHDCPAILWCTIETLKQKKGGRDKAEKLLKLLFFSSQEIRTAAG